MSAPPPFRRSLASSTALALLAVAFVIVRNELDRLIGEVLSVDGHTHSLGSVTGFTAAAQTGAWAAWKSASAAASAETFIAASALLGLLFVCCYFWLGYRLVRHSVDAWNEALPEDEPRVSLLKAALPLIVLGGLNALGDILIFALDVVPSAGLGWLPGVFALVAYLTIAAAIVVGLQLILSEVIGTPVRRFLFLAIRAIYAQRLAAIVVFAIAALSLLPLPNLFEQISDVYRGWVTFPPDAGFLPVFSGPTIATLILDFVAFALTGFSLFALGRERATHYSQLTATDDRPPARYRYWLLFAAGVALVALVVGLLTDWASIDLIVIGIFLAAVIAIPGISALIRLIVGNRNLSKPFLKTDLESHASEVRRAGDLLVATWIAIWVLGPFKALVSPVFLAVTGEFAGSRFANSFWTLLVFELILLTVGVGGPITFRFLIARYAAALRNMRVGRERAIHILSVTAIAASAVCIAALLLLPTVFAPLLGPVGALVLLIGCWATMIGMLIVVSGRRKPFALFQVLKLRSTPIVTLLIVVPLAISFVDVPPTLHAIRATAGRTLEARHSVSTAFRLWNAQQAACTTRLDNDVSIRPLLLFAAEGGGIRAATWTVDVLRSLPGENACAGGATFLSSGASGGSIGLATFQHAGNAASNSKDVATLTYGGPNALASDVAGLLDGDLIGGVTGVRVPSPSDIENPFDAAWTWHDRTALQELTWESEAPQFARPYDVTADTPTGYLILNSEDSVTNCKVVVSQLNLGATTNQPNGTSGCAGPGNELSNTIDLEDYIGNRCMADLNWSTAAELSARFPVVSPPGRVAQSTLPASCLGTKRANLESMQLVDGGTADNSGIGTMSDLSPELSAVISGYNATATGSQTSPFVVPLVIYAASDPGLDLTSTPNKTKPDALVPITAVQDAQSALVTPSAWLTRIANGLSQVCAGYAAVNPKGTACAEAVSGTRALIPQGIVVASPSTEPAVSQPLGWALSGFARTRLRLEALAQAKCGSEDSTIDKECRANRGYGKLGSILDLFRYSVQQAP
jgi:hypothetical protein